MKLLLILCLCLLSACTKTLKIEDSGTIQNITVKNSDFLGSESITESLKEGESFKSVITCSHPGVCCKCGFTMNMKHECSCGMWRNCPGVQDVTLKPVTEHFRHHYTIKRNNQTVKLKSPLFVSTYNKTMDQGTCH